MLKSEVGYELYFTKKSKTCSSNYYQNKQCLARQHTDLLNQSNAVELTGNNTYFDLYKKDPTITNFLILVLEVAMPAIITFLYPSMPITACAVPIHTNFTAGGHPH